MLKLSKLKHFTIETYYGDLGIPDLPAHVLPMFYPPDFWQLGSLGGLTMADPAADLQTNQERSLR
jgi:hypothetical protein